MPFYYQKKKNVCLLILSSSVFSGHLTKRTKFLPFPLALYLFELTLCGCNPKPYHQLSPSDLSRSGDQVQLQHLDSSLSVRSRKRLQGQEGCRVEWKWRPSPQRFLQLSQRFMSKRKELRQKVLLTVGTWLFVHIYLAHSMHPRNINYYYLVLFKVDSHKLQTTNKLLFCSHLCRCR